MIHTVPLCVKNALCSCEDHFRKPPHRRAGLAIMKKSDDYDDSSLGLPRRRQAAWRGRLIVGGCAIFSLLLCSYLIADEVAADMHDQHQRLPVSERAVAGLENLAAVVMPAPNRHVAPPCAVNISGYSCPNRYGENLNRVYSLEAGSSPPLYRSKEGFWLAHSPIACLSRSAWIVSRSKPDESVHGACDIEAHIFHSAELPIGTLKWSYASCGAAGVQHGSRRLTVELIRKCDCPTAGEASDTDLALGSADRQLYAL